MSGKQDAALHVDIFCEADTGTVITGVGRKKCPVTRTRLEAVVGP